MIPIKKVIRMAGGARALVQALGPQATPYTLGVWTRAGVFPEEWRPAVARAAGIDVADLWPDDVGRKRLLPKHKPVARVYEEMFHTVGLSLKTAARLHGTTQMAIQRWMSGHDEVPAWAFDDIYQHVTGRARRKSPMTIQEATHLTGLDIDGLCDVAGVRRLTGREWEKKGVIPHKSAIKIRGFNRRY